MNIEFLGRGVQLQLESYSRVWLSAQDMLELMVWAKEHEIELAAKAREVEREHKEIVRFRNDEHPPYYIGER